METPHVMQRLKRLKRGAQSPASGVVVVVFILMLVVARPRDRCNRRPHHISHVPARKPAAKEAQAHCSVAVRVDVIAQCFRVERVAEKYERKLLEFVRG